MDRDWNLCISLSPTLCIVQVRTKVLLTNLFFFFICWLQFAQSPRSCHSHVYPTPSVQQSFEQKRRNEDLGISMFFMVDFLYVFYIINSQESWKFYINMKLQYSAVGHLEIKSVITNTEVDCTFPAGIYPHSHSRATIKWQWWSETNFQIATCVACLLFCQMQPISTFNLEWKTEQRTEENGERIWVVTSWLSSNCCKSHVLCMLMGVNAASALFPPSLQGSGDLRWVVENKLLAETHELSISCTSIKCTRNFDFQTGTKSLLGTSLIVRIELLVSRSTYLSV